MALQTNCNNVNTPAVTYHLLAVLETSNPPGDDANLNGLPGSYALCAGATGPATGYQGKSVDCVTVYSSGSDRCYDVVPQ